jgi:uncharacterized membrane protein
MTGYHIALFIHICGLLVAIAALGVIALAMRRIRSARTGAEALPWLEIDKAVARAFPLAILMLFGSGAYMVHKAWSWDTGWVDVGIAGLVFLGLVGDRVQGGRARLIAKTFAEHQGPIEGKNAELQRDRVWWTASMVNPALALGVVYAMVSKLSLGGSIAAVAVAVGVGAAVAVPFWRSDEAPVAIPSAD